MRQKRSRPSPRFRIPPRVLGLSPGASSSAGVGPGGTITIDKEEIPQADAQALMPNDLPIM